MFIELSHYFENDMPGFRVKNPDGSTIQYSAKIYPFRTHQQTAPLFDNKASFEITQMEFQTSVGTYLDSPYHRYENSRDIGSLTLDELILEGIIIDAKRNLKFPQLSFNDIQVQLDSLELKNKVVLFNFGWDKYWKNEKYHSYPFISESIINYLIKQQIKMIGVDTINIDDHNNLYRPAHSKFLKENILILENLCNLDQLIGKSFELYAIPLRAKATAAMPVRAFAKVR